MNYCGAPEAGGGQVQCRVRPSAVFAGHAKRTLGFMLFLNRPQDILDTVFRNLTTEFGCLYIRGAIMKNDPPKG
jgi:hypothetical protein